MKRSLHLLKAFRSVLFSVLLLFVCSFVEAQNAKIDGLLEEYDKAETDSAKLAINNQVIWQYLFSDKDKAWEYILISEDLARKKGQAYGYISLINIKGIYFDVNDEPDSSLYYFKKAIELSAEHKTLDHHEHSLNNLGMYYWNKGQLEDALKSFLESLSINEKRLGKDNDYQDAILNNIGLLYQELNLYSKAITYHLKAYDQRRKRRPTAALMASLNNLGICYNSLGETGSAKKYLFKGIELRDSVNDEMNYYKIASTLASTFYMEKDYAKAFEYTKISAHRPENVPFPLNDKVRVYNDMAYHFLRLKQVDSALYYAEEGENIIGSDTDFAMLIPELYLALNNAYLMKGDFETASEYNEQFLRLVERKFNEESSNALQELEVKYETEKKDKELLEAALELSAAQKTRNMILGGALVLLLILLLIFNAQRLKTKQLKVENELNHALVKIETQNQLQQQRLEISRNLHDNIGAQLSFIISAIDNLKIFNLDQDKLVLKYDQLSEFTRNAISDLRDTIWAMNKDQINFEDLKTRVMNFIHQAKDSIPSTEFEFTYPENSEFSFKAKRGIEVFRIIQESVNNAVKHASAKRISVEISEDQGSLNIEVKDDGKGFEFTDSAEGNGIRSIQSRAKLLNAEVQWLSSEKGTVVQIKLA